MNSSEPVRESSSNAPEDQTADIVRKIRDASELARGVHELLAPSGPWWKPKSPATAVAVFAALSLGCVQVFVECQRMNREEKEYEWSKEKARTEHNWGAERETRERHASYLQSITKATNDRERLFVVEAIGAGLEPDERQWADSIKSNLTRLADEVESKIQADQAQAEEGRQKEASLTERRDVETNLSKRRVLEASLREQAKKVARDESRIRVLQLRLNGTQTSVRSYLCEVEGNAYPLKIGEREAEQECQRIAQKVCARSSAQLCERRLTEL